MNRVKFSEKKIKEQFGDSNFSSADADPDILGILKYFTFISAGPAEWLEPVTDEEYSKLK